MCRLDDVVRTGDKQQKLNVSRLTSEFSAIVAAYSRCHKETAAKQRTHVLQQHSSDDDAAALQSGGGDSSTGYQQQQQLQHQQQIRASLEFERSVLLDREQRVAGIQRNVVDINAIMQQLGTMTQLQASNIGECVP